MSLGQRARRDQQQQQQQQNNKPNQTKEPHYTLTQPHHARRAYQRGTYEFRNVGETHRRIDQLDAHQSQIQFLYETLGDSRYHVRVCRQFYLSR
jgi:hypothetical protein